MDELSQAVELLLCISRSEENVAQKSLAALLHTVRLQSGEAAILEVLTEAKRRASTEMQKNTISESVAEVRKISDMLMTQNSILSETGNQEKLKNIFEDGSSVLCTKCRGLVAKVRWESHMKFWCPAMPIYEEDDVDG